jgi:hypothetical protein
MQPSSNASGSNFNSNTAPPVASTPVPPPIAAAVVSAQAFSQAAAANPAAPLPVNIKPIPTASASPPSVFAAAAVPKKEADAKASKESLVKSAGAKLPPTKSPEALIAHSLLDVLLFEFRAGMSVQGIIEILEANLGNDTEKQLYALNYFIGHASEPLGALLKKVKDQLNRPSPHFEGPAIPQAASYTALTTAQVTAAAMTSAVFDTRTAAATAKPNPLKSAIIFKLSALKSEKEPVPFPGVVVRSPFDHALYRTSTFKGYRFADYSNLTLTGMSVRPADMFLEAVFGSNKVPQPGTAALFHFKQEDGTLKTLESLDPTKVFKFSAQGKKGIGRLNVEGQEYHSQDISEVYGDGEVEVSAAEIRKMLGSFKIYTPLPLNFFIGLKEAMRIDMLNTGNTNQILPGTDAAPLLLSELRTRYPETDKFLRKIEAALKVQESREAEHTRKLQYLIAVLGNGKGAEIRENDSDVGKKTSGRTKAPVNEYGFAFVEDYTELLNYTLYQIGSLVVRSADNIIFVDGDMRLRPRKAGENDMVRQIDLSGIRGMLAAKTPKEYNQRILKRAFMSAFAAGEKGKIIFPAVGLGVWGGDPDVYWRAFLDATIAAENHFQDIYVLPSHQATERSRNGFFVGATGNEFELLLEEYRNTYKKDGRALAKLRKVQIYFDKDILQFAQRLKEHFPDECISYVNASDPDVTLGFCTGMYVLNWPHFPTTEENFAAASAGLLMHLLRDTAFKEFKRVVHVP